jgi:8-oxo-dGTP pyrophosphatase MutT (NUDIX family)
LDSDQIEQAKLTSSGFDAALKLLRFQGGKVKRGEALVKALKREVHEETGLRVEVGSLLGVLDRHDEDAIMLLFAAIPDEQSREVKPKNREIAKASFHERLPQNASPSAKYFWLARRGPIKKAPTSPASKHQFPTVAELSIRA